ncbi:response regulator [Chryseobacterium sp. Leaf394]|uniref:response regulator n=1 Tax=Chryseobacterium sp. Leaf394 TaxID=1736361 RepID=UPI000701EAA2|nr:response regulator [Chryseobacterium sp. Leaf394]KQS91636.1 histidine kinase [Chryseobacterium sp. Leaf394]
MQNTKILICDDDKEIVCVLTILLESEGYIVIAESDSTRLIEKIKVESPDILLLDIWMPQILGDEIIRLIRADSDLNKLPVIAFSASHNTEGIAMEAGANDYISKPFDIDDVLFAVNNLLK